jgi:hypothetical protein
LSVAATLSAGGSNVPISTSVGGAGGSGGSAAQANLTNNVNVTVWGSDSRALVAQSIGGGGGGGGVAVSGSLSITTQGGGASFAVGVGGSGGAAGDGSSVNVSNTGVLQTSSQANAAAGGSTGGQGIIAQSIGGGGGSGGWSGVLSATTANNGSVALDAAVGGKGGAAGNAGSVHVGNSGSITTWSTNSEAILAQSTGGGGSAEMTIGATPNVSYNTTVTIGGTGGTGGNAAEVDVTNSGKITVYGNNGAGIVARSIGGGGGDSEATSVSVSASGEATGKRAANLGVSVGLTGASGGSGGPVNVVNNAPITTSPLLSTSQLPADPPLGWQAPINSYGIFAQSVGGGTGGAALQMIPGLQANNTTVNAKVSVGGAGGSGGPGGPVEVTNTATITTSQSESYAIAAQSVGGGGGKGGAAASLAGTLINDQSSVLNIGVNVGGGGGTGNDANTVTVTNTGGPNIVTSGTSAYAIFAQSVGGGGGDGGSAAAFAIGGGCKAGASVCTSAMQVATNVAVGGNGGGGGNGNTVTVNNTATVATHGDDAIGIFAQSVGGGGGVGGNGSTATTFPSTTLSVAVGGQGGAAGDGGKVLVNHYDWGIETKGANSPAIYAQSVGGGGGRGGVGLYTPLLTVPIGGPGGSSGNGSEVDVYVAFGGVNTSGSGRSYGILAQSIGGGEAGGLGVGIVDPVYPTSVPTLAVQTGSSTLVVPGNGNGGPVTVTVQKTPITTVGDDAIGIFAQSVVGGGGVAGQTASGCTAQPCGYTVGSTKGTGNSGLVQVALSEGTTVTTTGQYSHGIFAQSAAGAGGGALPGGGRRVASLCI